MSKTDTCHLCEERGPLYRGSWEPFESYREGDIVEDREDSVDGVKHTEPGGQFVSLACQRSGILNPRYSVIDVPGRWRRVAGTGEPARSLTTETHGGG